MAAAHHQVWTGAQVVEVDVIAQRVRRIVLSPDRMQTPAAPGSHVDIAVEVHGRSEVRSYSVVDCGPRRNQIVIGVQLAEPTRGGSASLHGMRPGQRVRITEPLQNFPLGYGAPAYVLVAGGIGITALVAMGRALKTRGADYRFVYAGRSRAAMAFADELVAEHGDRMDLHIGDEGGRIDIEALVAGVPPGGELYFCGPAPMLAAIQATWARAGRRPADLRFETFGSGGRFDSEAFRLVIPRLGLETTVAGDVSMLEALESPGVEMMSDCRRGECGLCQIKVLEVRGVIDHRDVFLSEAQRQRNDRLQSCVSRVVGPPPVGGAGSHSHREPGTVSIDLP
ncbi:PDR/VanB family oxidoreductase [Nakamurella sp. PAMC28650]|jgi:ferredoxin-NADP reductase|uniref:PDR/VanB family oxidoreductase n=1 Tax=Nakamurella sp. PAMC28650 TaxID=2762325 RepID=UPI00164E2587|nr:PDR/VanB family oxidoreductase [Nakamurella sp. PAMC28650]QNK80761.1 oxidoreductase [Nakamurella sp. PAMC28650]